MNPEIRKAALGGTDVAAIVGASPFASPWDIYARVTGLLDDVVTETNERMQIGKLMERPVAHLYTMRTGRAHEWRDTTQLDPKTPYFCWTPDAMVPKDRGLDCKCVAWDQADKWGEGLKEVPEHIAVQGQWYMARGGVPYWDIAAFFGGSELRIYTLQRDEEFIGLLEDEANRFWSDHVLAGKEPPVTATPTAKAYLKQKFPKDDGVLLDTPSEVVADYIETRRQFKELEKRKDSMEAAIKLAIGEHYGLIGPWGKITLGTIAASEIAAYTRSSYRRIDVREKKGK